MRARIRGIYATALTRLLLDAGHEVVQASSPIRRRFEADFETADHDVAVDATADRRGVEIAGDPDAVTEAAAQVDDLALDAFTWADPAPRGAVFDARVTDTLGRGAVCDLGTVDGADASGFLPFDEADEHVAEGDALRVQVVDGRPPWRDGRPVLSTTVAADAGLAALVPGEGVRVDAYDAAAGRELAGMTDLLDVDVPDGWGVRWRREATEADMDALSSALSRAVDRARDLDGLPEAVDAPRRLAAPRATTWGWLGRDARFSLDEARRAVTTTMPGHHRTKAACEAASGGVDLVEALCGEPAAEAEGEDADVDFPFAVVTDQYGPVEGDDVSIGHGKPDGRLITLGEGEVVERQADGNLSVRRELTAGGTLDALDVPIEAGDTALTKFREGRWWYPTVYRDADGNRKGTYVNVCTPVECFPDQVRYVDLYVDVLKHADGTVERVDDDELDAAEDAGHVGPDLAEKARKVAAALEKAL